MIHPRNEKTNRYPLFEQVFGDVQHNTVLDFGGSSGNLLYFSNNHITEHNYTSIDIVEEAVIRGAQEFPNAAFYHYDRYNWMYNHHGNLNLKFPNIDKNQDYIWAYSVFSHTDLDEFVNTVKWFLTFNFKKIAISFLTFNEMLEWAYNKRTEEFTKSIDVKKYVNTTDHNIIYFFDNNKLIVDKEKINVLNSKYLLTFYSTDFIFDRFKNIASGYKINIVKPGNGYVPFLCIEK